MITARAGKYRSIMKGVRRLQRRTHPTRFHGASMTPSRQSYQPGTVREMICAACGTIFTVNAHRLNKGQGKWCSRKCYHSNHPFTPLAERFWRMVSKSDDCWEWSGSLSAFGYGQISGRPEYSRPLLAHRVSWELHNGPIPDGLQLDHLCRNRKCVNPAHLEPVTLKVNTLRGESPCAINARKTVCKFGHTLADAYVSPRGVRLCRTCRKLKNRLRYAALRGGVTC